MARADKDEEVSGIETRPVKRDRIDIVIGFVARKETVVGRQRRPARVIIVRTPRTQAGAQT